MSNSAGSGSARRAAWSRLCSAPAPRGPSERDRALAERVTGPCSCSESYTSRRLVAPDCAWHEMAELIADALAGRTAFCAGIARAKAARLADVVRRAQASAQDDYPAQNAQETAEEIAEAIEKGA